MGQKVARSVTLGLSGILLSLIGYEESIAEQSAQTGRNLAWLFGAGVGSLFVLASFVFLLTPVSRERQETIQRAKAKILSEKTE